MVKILIMLIELTPVLQKLFLSPKTLYALKLDSERKQKAYEHLKQTLTWEREEIAERETARIITPVDPAVTVPLSVVRPDAPVRGAALARPKARPVST
jgi:hypothetical protein